MVSLLSLAVSLLLMPVLFCALYLVVRTAVKEGILMALRRDLLDERALAEDDVP